MTKNQVIGVDVIGLTLMQLVLTQDVTLSSLCNVNYTVVNQSQFQVVLFVMEACFFEPAEEAWPSSK